MFFAMKATLIAFVTYIFASVFGMTLMPTAVLNDNNENSEFIALLSPVLGAAVWIACIVPLGIVLGYTRYLLYAFFAVAFLFVYLKRSKIFIPSTRVYWFFLIIIIALTFASCCYISPFEIGGKIYFGPALYDHVKAALIDSIARYGLPPKNPWIANNGVPVDVVYYYGLHAFAAQLTLLFDISGYMADAALVLGFSVLINTSLTMAITLKLARSVALDKPWHKKLLLISFCLMFFAWRLSVYFDFLPLSMDSAFSRNICVIGFCPTLNTIQWSSQHPAAASFTVLVIYLYSLLLATKDKKEGKELTVLIGLVASASFMTSVYAGIFPFVFLFIASGLVYIAKGDFRKEVNSKIVWQLFAVAIVCVITSSYMVQIFTKLGNAPLEFGALPGYSKSLRGGLFPFVEYLALFYFIILPNNLGLFYVLGICFVIAHLFSKKKKENQNRFFLFGEILVISTLIAITFIHSTVYSNDFGWRTLEPVMSFLYAFSALSVAKIYDALYESKKSKQKFAYAFVIFIAVIQACTFISLASDFRKRHEAYPQLRETFVKSVSGWEKVREVTGEKDLVLSNPATFKNLCYVGDITEDYCVDTFFSCYSRRSTPVSAPCYSWCYSINYDLEKLNARFDRVVKFFAGNPPQSEVNYIADDLKVKAILVTPLDGLWKNEGKLNTRYKKVFSTEDYKVFVNQ